MKNIFLQIKYHNTFSFMVYVGSIFVQNEVFLLIELSDPEFWEFLNYLYNINGGDKII